MDEYDGVKHAKYLIEHGGVCNEPAMICRGACFIKKNYGNVACSNENMIEYANIYLSRQKNDTKNCKEIW